MRKNQVIALVGVLIAGSCGIARADHPTIGFGAGIAGPAITIPATTLPKASGAVTLRVEYVKFRTFSDAELTQFAGQNIEAHSVNYLVTPSVGAGYGFTDDLTIGLRLPYVLRTDIREGHNEGNEVVIDTHGDSNGVGDLTVLGQYRFLNNMPNSLECALLVGIKIPTGATGVKDRNGELFETEHQPGSGSWEPLLGMAGAISFDANLLYTFATRGAQRTNLGDRLHYNLATSYRLGNEKSHHHSHETAEHQHLAWDLMFEVNGEWQMKQDIANVVNENSGWAATLSVGVPVIEDRNGVQHETDVRMVFGLSKGF